MSDALGEHMGRLRALEQAPLDEHPDVLEEVGDAIAAELDEVGRLDSA
ncbi:MAG: hypothetical protein ACQETV_05455 [Actinomycetota bacterium]